MIVTRRESGGIPIGEKDHPVIIKMTPKPINKSLLRLHPVQWHETDSRWQVVE